MTEIPSNIESIKSDANKENKKEENLVDDSTRMKMMPEEVKVLESMENMDTSDIVGMK